MNDPDIAASAAARVPRLTTVSLTVAELCGEYSFLVMPFILAAMMEAFHLSESTAGRLVSLQLLGMTVASALVSFVVRPGRSPRPILGLAVLAIVVANSACALSHSTVVVAGARALTGLGEGAAMAAAIAAVCSTANPHRIFSVIGIVVAIVAIVSLAATPYIASHAGPVGVFWMLALLPLPVVPLLGKIPVVSEAASAAQTGNALSAVRHGAPVLLSYLAFWAGSSGIWVYAERIGAAQGMTAQKMGLLLSLGQILSTPGPLVSAWVGPRAGMRVCIAVGCAGMAVAAGCFVFGGAPWTYGLGAFFLSFFLLAVVPCFRSRMADLDPTGRTVALSVGAYTIGFGVAPLVVSAVTVEGHGYAAAGVFCILCFAASALLGTLRGAGHTVARSVAT